MKDEPSFGRHSWTAKGQRVESRNPNEVAILLLGQLANLPERLDRFFALTGLAPADMRKAASEPSFSAAVLDYVVSDERLLLELAAESGLAPETVASAHAALSHTGDDPV